MVCLREEVRMNRFSIEATTFSEIMRYACRRGVVGHVFDPAKDRLRALSMMTTDDPDLDRIVAALLREFIAALP